MRQIPPLPKVILEPMARAALLEDLGRAGDMTTDAIVPQTNMSTVNLVSREAGIVAGLDLASVVFKLVEPQIDIIEKKQDGACVEPGDIIASLHGPARGLLTGERTALNFLCHMSGVATATASIVDAIREHKTTVACTRKTMPGLRALQKYAMRVGGGSNHRFGLDDAILIKDNHVAIAGGIQTALERAKLAAGHMVKIEIEVDTLDQLEQVLAIGVNAVLLDNMTPPMLVEAVGMVDGRAITEASGRITPETAPAIAATGVDMISVGWLTHSTKAMDIGLDYAG